MLWALGLVALLFQAAQSGDALLDAARDGDVAEARRLLDAGVDVNFGNRYQATALFFAADKGDLEMVRLLVERGARLDVRDTFYQMSAIARALSNDHRDVALYLLERNPGDADGVLATAMRSDDAELARAALASGGVTREAYDEARATSSGELRSVIDASPRPAPSSARWNPAREELEALVGRYQNETTDVAAEVALDGERLVFREDGATRPLEAGLSPRSFLLQDGTEVVFAGRGGMVERVLVGDTSYRPFEETESRAPAVESPNALTATTGSDVDERRGPPRPWPAFRGPDRSGNADGQGIPVEWDAVSGKNIRFKTAIPGFSVSSPIVWGNRIFVVTAVSSSGDATFRTGLYGDVAPVEDVSEHRWLLYALDTSDGHVVWERELHRGIPGTKRHTKSSQANATPVTDGERVITVLGSVGKIYCHDYAGELLWTKDVGVLNVGWFYDPDYQWGHASSPIIYGERVILQSDSHGSSFIAAYAIATGEELWRTERPDEIPTFATPTVYRGESGDEVVTNGTQVRGYDPATGELLWHLAPNSEIPIGSPVVTEDLIFVTAGYPPVRPIYAIRPGSRGDLSVDANESMAWSKNRGGTYIPTPIAYGGLLYLNANNGRLTAYDARTGEEVYRERIGGVGGSYAASPIAADGRLYFTNEDGETFVVRAGPEYGLIAKNSVDGVVLSTPAASNGLLVIRTLGHVYGIANAQP